MKYNLADELDRERFNTKATFLKSKGAVVELTEKTIRTNNQNAYLHVCIGIVAMECGLTCDYVKEYYYKRLCNPDIFIVKTQDPYLGQVSTLRSSSEITKEQMSVSLDRFKVWASQQGWYIPEPEEESKVNAAQVAMDKIKAYL